MGRGRGGDKNGADGAAAARVETGWCCARVGGAGQAARREERRKGLGGKDAVEEGLRGVGRSLEDVRRQPCLERRTGIARVDAALRAAAAGGQLDGHHRQEALRQLRPLAGQRAERIALRAGGRVGLAAARQHHKETLGLALEKGPRNVADLAASPSDLSE